MYRILIAEDEMLVRLGLKSMIEWDKFNMKVIADVANGQDAWRVYEEHRPEIIITDIKMPVMDGMELISKIRLQDQHTKIVILTCLEQFNLLHKAMSLGVSDYIVKLTMTSEEMENVLQKLHTELQASQPQIKVIPNLDVDALKENIFKDFMFRNRYTENEFSNTIAGMNLRLKAIKLTLCIMEIDQYKQLQDKFKDEKGQLIRISLLNVLEEVLQSHGRGEAFHDEDNRYVLLFSFHDMVSEQKITEILQQILEHIRKVMLSYFNVSISFGISTQKNGYSALRLQYNDSIQVLEKKFFLGFGAVLNCREGSEKRFEEIIKEKLVQHIHKWETVDEEQSKAMYISVSNLYESGSLSIKADIKGMFVQWLQWPMSSLHVSDAGKVSLFASYADRLLRATILDQMIDISNEFLDQIIEIKSQRKLSREVIKVLSYIERSYAGDIPLQQAASHVGISPGYLSALFKKEMGINFVEYLLKFRIEKAKALLLSTQMKSYEIAERVGMDNHTYFSKMFKRTTGVGPREFRNQWMTNPVEENAGYEED
ncbi:DNA-binding response regulator [Paenibacillus baekrokdamisoli]|uniref:DNA-binding response regulator n=1 Tax=Paenibacillus baekrokdamisoli TaxID=1712516 RepID=A0A3G9INU1_9BACL|nr:response regulator [Paenibacillus baekrokdamisoli]MBB3072462.1 YesN/AraC family two-component response regulator [Paenibacillus baekrokdamisoli]BBH20520.1 DNA-binding response regulator [Paenibacillus baekrokdamisoli]